MLKNLTLLFFCLFAIGQTMSQNAVASFTLINASDNSDILVLEEGIEVNIALLESTQLNIRANTAPEQVGSVFLEISGPVTASRNENVAPYALFGDMGGNYEPANLPIGTYMLTATPYSGKNQGGTMGTALTIQFSVVELFPNQPPISIPMADPIAGEAPLTVAFTGENSFDDNQITAFLWDFKDGNGSAEANPTHIFTTPGIYAVALTVTDDDAQSNTETITITVDEVFVNQPPTAQIEASRTEGIAPLTIQFMGSGSSDDIGITEYLWDFGDGQQSTLANPSHLFSEPGTYEVSLTVFDSEGLQDGQTLNITVLDSAEVLIEGELKKWHRVQLLFNGPYVSELDATNPFLDYRLNVRFTSPSGASYLVPGFYAADGNAAETSADAGNKWAVRFNPDEIGQWDYEVSFRTGERIAITTEENIGTPLGMDGVNGSFTISENDKSLPDNRANGRLNVVGGHFYQFAETQTYFLKAGSDSPENLLAYSDFDNTTASKNWLPHQSDWTSQDPSWQQNKGTGLVGAINYLSERGMNAFSFITMNVNGDGEDVWPWSATEHAELDENTPTEIDNRLRYDVSKLEQWEIIFSHGDAKGMFLHFKTQETENDLLLDGGELDVQRKLYYRELIARFSHHLALNWNLGEENDIYEELNDPTNTRLIAYADYIHDLDPYDHPITVHSFPDQQGLLYPSLLGPNNQITGPSIQSQLVNIHEDVKNWVVQSKNAGKPWAVANDEQGNAQTGVAADESYPGNTGSIADNRSEVRHQVLWGTLLAGGYGVEYYFGYATGETDLTAEDFRSRETKWNDAKLALDFFHEQLPFWQMENADLLTSNEQAFCLAQADQIYVVYLPAGQSTQLDLLEADGSFSVSWFDPVNGGELQNGSTQILVGGTNSELGGPPANITENDWVVLVKKLEGSPLAVINADKTLGEAPLEVNFNGDGSADDNAIVSYLWDFADGESANTTNPTHVFTDPGTYEVVLTVTDEEGLQDTDQVSIVVEVPAPTNLPPTAVASGTPLSGEAPLEVSFTGSASTDDNAVFAHAWDFADGQNSQQSDPVHTFTDPGTYEVVLTVSDEEGLQDSTTVTIVVSAPIPVNLPPTAIASATPLSGEVPLEVSFTGSASTDDNAVFAHAWDFADGQNSQQSDPIHTFTDPGTYEVVLTVSDEEGLQDSTTVTIVVSAPIPVNLPPTAVAFATPLTGEAPLEVSFTGSASTDDNAVFAHAWDFADGQNSQQSDPVHTFTDPGTYEVVLTVSDEEGLQDSATVTIVVNDPNVEGISSFVLVNATTNEDILTLNDGIQLLNSQTENLQLNIRANTNPPTFGSVLLQLAGPIEQTRTENVAPYAIFGDASGNYAGQLLPIGEYTIRATPFGGRNLSGMEGPTEILSFSIVEEIGNQPPLAVINADKTLGEAPLEVNFNGDGSADDNAIVSYLWDFADGESANTTNPTHVFTDPGTYEVVLTVTDEEGLQDTDQVSIVVEVPAPTNLPPTAVASGTPLSGEAPLEVSFMGSASTDDNAVFAHAWDFADGQNSQQSDPVHTFTDPGTYEVVLTVSDEEGLQDSTTVTIVVSAPIPVNLPPTAIASATPLSGEAPLEVSFTGSASTDDNAVFAHAWDFADGQNSQQSDPIHTFTDPGTYEVVLTVSDEEGLQDSTTVTIVVSAPIPVNLPPTAIASATPLTGETPLEVSFTGSASTDDNAVFAHAWDFADGQNSQQSDPVHTFTDPGTYEVVLTVSDEEGLQDSTTVTIVVSAPIDLPPIAMATATPLIGEAPLEVFFNSDGSSDDMAIVSYSWDFSDGTTSSEQNPSHLFTTAGSYLVSLTVEDVEQQTATSTVTIVVEENSSEDPIRFTLVDAIQDTDIQELFNNQQLLATETEGTELNIRADVHGGTVGSVLLEMSGPISVTRTENVAPYALFGDISGDYSGKFLPEGNYTISATPYSARNLKGEAGETVSLNFSIVAANSPVNRTKLNALTMNVYPNRSFDEIHLDLPKGSSSKIMEVHLYDLQGRKVKRLDRSVLKWENNNAIVPVMDIGLEEGYYIVMAITEKLQLIQTKMLVGKY